MADVLKETNLLLEELEGKLEKHKKRRRKTAKVGAHNAVKGSKRNIQGHKKTKNRHKNSELKERVNDAKAKEDYLGSNQQLGRDRRSLNSHQNNPGLSFGLGNMTFKFEESLPAIDSKNDIFGLFEKTTEAMLGEIDQIFEDALGGAGFDLEGGGTNQKGQGVVDEEDEEEKEG